MAKKAIPTPEQLRQLLDYDPNSGSFKWRLRGLEWFSDGKRPTSTAADIWNGRWAGRPALNYGFSGGYRGGMVCGVRVLAHRVAWAIVFGHWPDGEIDHINHVRGDNRLCNLRSVSSLENARNRSMDSRNSSGVNGVSWSKKRRKWEAYIKVAERQKFLGYFDTLEHAAAARKAADARYGYHSNHGA